MMKIWIILSILSVFIQYFIAKKKWAHFIGSIIPLCFLGFSFYISQRLLLMGMNMFTVSAFFIPPITLFSIFELVYWHMRCHTFERM